MLLILQVFWPYVALEYLILVDANKVGVGRVLGGLQIFC